MEKNNNNYAARYLSVSSHKIILYRYVLIEKENNMLLDILQVSVQVCVNGEEQKKIMLLDILVFLLTISYCTGIY